MQVNGFLVDDPVDWFVGRFLRTEFGGVFFLPPINPGGHLFPNFSAKNAIEGGNSGGISGEQFDILFPASAPI